MLIHIQLTLRHDFSWNTDCFLTSTHCNNTVPKMTRHEVSNYLRDLLFQVSDKKRGKASHSQDVKEVSVSNNARAWTRPRCGVPDHPAQTKQLWQNQPRQRRFVLYGGRMDKTDLTYRYSSDHPTLWPRHTCVSAALKLGPHLLRFKRLQHQWRSTCSSKQHMNDHFALCLFDEKY